MTVGSAGWSRAKRAGGREKTRDAVVDTALRLFAEHGYVGVRVEDIAKAAGVSRATFYKYFSEREEILADLFDRLLGDDPPDIDTGAAVRDEVPRVLAATAARMVEQEELARFVYALPIRHAAVVGREAAAPSVFGPLATLVRAGLERGEIRPDVPVEVLVEVLGRMFEGGMRDWAEGRAERAPEQVAALVALVLHGALTAGPD